MLVHPRPLLGERPAGDRPYLALNMVASVDGRATLLDEIRGGDPALREYLVAEFSALFGNPKFAEALGGHLPGDSGSQQRLPRLRARLRALAAITDNDAQSAA